MAARQDARQASLSPGGHDELQKFFALGDYRKIAPVLDIASKHAVGACRLGAGSSFLDVAAGTGNAAVHAAGTGASVVACDLSDGMIAWGRARTEAQGLDIKWVRAPLEDLPFTTGAFDCVTSVFGVMMSIEPAVAISEIFRVLRPAGQLALVNWTSDGLVSQGAEIRARYLGRPSPRISPQNGWGSQSGVRRRLAPWAATVSFYQGRIQNRFDSFDGYRSFQEANLGPHIAAKGRLGPVEYEQMMQEMKELVTARNTSSNGGLVFESEYLLAVARKNDHDWRVCLP